MTRRVDVRRTYDRIATDFDRTRASAWPEIPRFLDGRAGVTGLDLGCGNARHGEPLSGHVERSIGIDISRRVLETARRRSIERDFGVALVQGDAAAIPLRTGSIDLGVYVAALHHLPARSLRVESLDELDRVLSGGGVALIGVWSTTHDRFDGGSGFDTTVDWTLPDGTAVPRYYHIYDGEEFAADLDASGLETVERFESSGNWFAVVRSSTPRDCA